MTILIVSGVEGVRNCAEVVSKQLNMQVEFAGGRRGAVDLLRRREFAVVVLDETLVECDPEAAEAIWVCFGFVFSFLFFMVWKAMLCERKLRLQQEAAHGGLQLVAEILACRQSSSCLLSLTTLQSRPDFADDPCRSGESEIDL